MTNPRRTDDVSTILDNPASVIRQADRLQRQLALVATLTVALFLVVAAGALYFISTNHDLAAKGERAHEAACVLRADEQRRVVAGEAFLKLHPTGIPGISADDIRRSIDSERATIAALAVAQCD